MHKDNHDYTQALQAASVKSSTNKTIAMITHTWNIPIQVRDNLLSHHFILYWDAGYLCSQLAKNDPGTLYKEGRLYKIIYHNCTESDCREITSPNQVALSFRVPYNSTLPPVVLISCAR